MNARPHELSDDPVCPDCSSRDLELSDHGSSDKTGPWNEYECQECGCVFFDPEFSVSSK